MTDLQPDPRRRFYDRAYAQENYATFCSADSHFAVDELRRFVAEGNLSNKKCLEVGSGRGAFQDLVDDYTGLDLSESVTDNYHKPFVTGSAESLPFEDHRFDAIWSITVLEHVSNPEMALAEMRRVLKPGGLLYLKPAWHCRPWICEGIPVRSYGDLSLRQKWVKATLPIRNSLVFRAAKTLPVRLWRFLTYSCHSRPSRLRFKPLRANYETFWMVDSDACCSLDPLDVIQWFWSRGDEVVSHPTWKCGFLSRSEAVVVRLGSRRSKVA